MSRGVRLYFFLSKCIFTLTVSVSVDPDEMPHYFIWVITVCKTTRLQGFHYTKG